jgi:hypothetical protein
MITRLPRGATFGDRKSPFAFDCKLQIANRKMQIGEDPKLVARQAPRFPMGPMFKCPRGVFRLTSWW